MIRLLAVFLTLTLSVPAWSATYYVATTGNDSTGDGSITTPWRNPQKCAAPPVAAGDTCIVRNGTYTATPYVILITSGGGSAAGTATNPITIKSENPGGAVLVQPTRNATAVTIYVSRPYYVIEGFDIDGSSTTYNTGTSTSHAGIGIYASNVTVRRNHIHDIARTQCGDSAFGNAGVFVAPGLSNILIEYNWIHTIGRLRNGESGCTTNKYQHDHGIYITWGTDITVRRNLIYDTNRGFPVNIYNTGTSVHTRYKIYNNTFAGRSPTGSPVGQIVTGGIWVDGEITNNLFYQPSTARVIQVFNLSTSSSGNVVSYNRTNVDVTGTASTFMFGGTSPTGFTQSNNTENSTIGFTDAACTQADGGCENYDFTLASGSNAINAGTSVTGVSCTGVCDQGAFETHGPVSASITASLLDVTYNTAYGPIQVGGATGHSVGCTTACGTLTVANASLFSSADSIVRYTVSGFSGGNCVDTQTITESFDASTGTLTDSINIGGTLNQPVHSYGPLAVTNNCDGGGSPTPPGSPHRLYELDGDGNDTSGNAGHATVSGGSFVAGKYGQALQGTDGVAVSATSDYGSGVNPSTQDLTIIFGYEVPAGATSLTRTFAGSSLGTDQRLHISAQSGTWQIAIGDSSTSVGTPSNLPVVEGWNRVCLRLDSTADVATLTVNNVTGTDGATKAIPNYTLASNIAFGLPSGFNTVVAGGGKWDKAVIYTSLVSCNDDWLAWEPPASPSVGTYAQTGARWLRVMDDGASGPVLYSTASTINVVQGGAVIYQSQTDCTAAACSAIGQKLWYTKNGGTAQEVPNAFTSDGVSFWGVNTSEHMYLGTATCCISGALTANDGTTQTTNVAQPTIELAQDASIVRNSVLRFADDATGTFCFHEREQNGNELDSVPTACVVLIPPQASGGF